MEERLIGLIILIVAAVSLIGCVIWIILSKRNGDWPKWPTKKDTFGDNEALLCVEDEDFFLDFSAERMALAAYCVTQAWKQLGYKNFSKVEKALRKSGAVITEPESFPKISGYKADKTAAVQLWMKTRILEKRFPVLVVHKKILEKLENLGRPMNEFGEPAIHELCHAASEIGFGDISYSHSDPRVWEATGKSSSLQAVAKRIWRDSVL